MKAQYTTTIILLLCMIVNRQTTKALPIDSTVLSDTTTAAIELVPSDPTQLIEGDVQATNSLPVDILAEGVGAQKTPLADPAIPLDTIAEGEGAQQTPLTATAIPLDGLAEGEGAQTTPLAVPAVSSDAITTEETQTTPLPVPAATSNTVAEEKGVETTPLVLPSVPNIMKEETQTTPLTVPAISFAAISENTETTSLAVTSAAIKTNPTEAAVTPAPASNNDTSDVSSIFEKNPGINNNNGRIPTTEAFNPTSFSEPSAVVLNPIAFPFNPFAKLSNSDLLPSGGNSAPQKKRPSMWSFPSFF